MKKKLKFKVEPPFIELVKLLRNNGFNTTCSCGHLPCPYIQMHWYDGEEIRKLYTLLVENNYRKFVLTAGWDEMINSRFLEVKFPYIKKQFANINDIKKG